MNNRPESNANKEPKTTETTNKNESRRGHFKEAKEEQVEQTEDDRAHNYDIDGVSMDSQGVRVATDETH